MITVSTVSPKGRRERNKLDKRERIRRAAWSLFTSGGYANTTTRAVADRAGVATGTLFLYAKDKRDLLYLALNERIRATLDTQLATLPRSAPLVDQLLHVFGGLFVLWADYPELAREFASGLPVADGPNARAERTVRVGFMQSLAELIRDAQARGEVDMEIQPLHAAANVFSLFYGTMTAWLAGFGDAESAVDPQLRRALELQIRGFAPRPKGRRKS